MSTSPSIHAIGRAGRARRQGGVVMWVAIVVLIVMTLAGLAMMRQMGTGVSIAGNIAFKENATSVADHGTEAARRWLLGQNATVLAADVAGAGYYATWGTSVDPATFNWSSGAVTATADDGTGNSVLYIVHRLCESLGPVTAPTQRCSDVEDNTGGSKGGSVRYGSNAITAPSIAPYYRLTTRVTGPRNTVSYTQVVMK